MAPPASPMHFWRVYRAPLLFMALVLASSILVLRQFQENDQRHIRMREDFIMLWARGRYQDAAWYYQRLVLSLNHLSDHALAEDYQRTQLMVQTNQNQLDSLVFKYYCQVRNVLDHRSEQRLQHLLKTPATREPAQP